MEKGAETLREISFQQIFGKELQEAYDFCRKYVRSGQTNFLDNAWEIYSRVYHRIEELLPQMTDLELQYVSPNLLNAKDLELAVPGTYAAGNPVVRISHFVAALRVISSKQRPRKLTLKGSDGKDYTFLLKGHEDLRQDERVMQLFGLVNTLLANDRDTSKRDLNIKRYSAIPLAPNSGLIEWLGNCDTMHAMIKEYRDARKIMLTIELKLLTQFAPDYQKGTVVQKIESFEQALANSSGQDLYKILWLKSKNSEVWFHRRTNFTRSLAVMSMVGYILGLGDRHPCNLMLDRFTGKLIHIDFGDCFEVAMQREKFPEKIPFRLTRMLINAMEVSGIEGNFRSVCESVMRVLRANKESVMAVLEAFVHDPLINWRLLKPNESPESNSRPLNLSLGDSRLSVDDDKDPLLLSNMSLEDESALSHPQSRLSMRQNRADFWYLVEGDGPSEALNARAVSVINRVSNKLTGKDFDNEVLDVPAQVRRLIDQATCIENLCQCYVGWCPFW
jgi:FKBP12-rapamycin complex-associated protein